MEWTFVANSAPPRLATIAPMMNAQSFMVTTFTPMVSATGSSSLMAIQARPIRESCNA
jgi:hypothetical protein